MKQEIDELDFRPRPLKKQDSKYLELICERYITELETKGWAASDVKEYVFEAALKMIYGNNIFEWINSNS